MLNKFFLIFCFFVGVQSDCQCYENYTHVGKSAPISNAFDSDNFSPCYVTECSYIADAGDDNYIWTRLTFHWGTLTNSGGLVQIFDGVTDTGTPLIQIAEGEAVNSGSGKGLLKSSTSKILIKYTQSGNSPNIYYGVMKALLANAN